MTFNLSNKETVIENGIKVYKHHRCDCPCKQRIPWKEYHETQNYIPKFIIKHDKIEDLNFFERQQAVINAKITTENGIKVYKYHFCKCKCKTRIPYPTNKGTLKDHIYNGIPKYIQWHSPPPPNKYVSKKTRKRMCINHADVSGSNNPNWNGGTSYIPYCIKFNKELKEQVRTRDNYTCQRCEITQEEHGKKLSIHHIHFDKENCYPDLIALCRSCNSIVNSRKNGSEKRFMKNLKQRGLLNWKPRNNI